MKCYIYLIIPLDANTRTRLGIVLRCKTDLQIRFHFRQKVRLYNFRFARLVRYTLVERNVSWAKYRGQSRSSLLLEMRQLLVQFLLCSTSSFPKYLQARKRDRSTLCINVLSHLSHDSLLTIFSAVTSICLS